MAGPFNPSIHPDIRERLDNGFTCLMLPLGLPIHSDQACCTVDRGQLSRLRRHIRLPHDQSMSSWRRLSAQPFVLKIDNTLPLEWHHLFALAPMVIANTHYVYCTVGNSVLCIQNAVIYVYFATPFDPFINRYHQRHAQ